MPTDEVTTIPIGTILTTGTATGPYFTGVPLVTRACVDLPASLPRGSDDGATSSSAACVHPARAHVLDYTCDNMTALDVDMHKDGTHGVRVHGFS